MDPFDDLARRHQELSPSEQTATMGAEMAALTPAGNSATPANATSTDGVAVGNLIDL